MTVAELRDLLSGYPAGMRVTVRDNDTQWLLPVRLEVVDAGSREGNTEPYLEIGCDYRDGFDLGEIGVKQDAGFTI